MPLRNLIANAWMVHTDGPSLLALAEKLEYALIAALGVPLLMLVISAIAGNMLQHRLVWSGESLKPSLSKISPAAGAKRVFGKQAAANFGKGIFKMVALGCVMSMILWPERLRLESMLQLGPVDDARPDHQPDAEIAWAPWWRCSRRSRSPIISSSTGNGTSGRRCRCRR